jgi:hypothetical protein
LNHRSWLAIPLLLITNALNPALAAPVPIRQVGVQADWSTPAAALHRFVHSGEIRDRGLLVLLEHAGWTSDELRVGLSKTYRVDPVLLASFLNGERGERFLAEHLGSYGPSGAPQTALVAMRSAILAAANDGLISSMELLAKLPTDFELRHQGGSKRATMPVCGLAAGMADERGHSWLSWLVFLPACLQAESARMNAKP